MLVFNDDYHDGGGGSSSDVLATYSDDSIIADEGIIINTQFERMVVMMKNENS